MLFLLNPILFFIAIGILLVVDTVLFSFEKYSWSFVVMAASIVGAYLVEPSFATFLKGNWPHVLTHYVPVYLLLGFGTAVVKWMLYTVKHVSGISDAKKTFDIRNPTSGDVEFEDERIQRERTKEEFSESIRRYNQQVNYAKQESERMGRDVVAVGSPPTEPAGPPVRDQAIINARRRKAFVDFYKKSFGYSSHPKVYEVDYAKDDSVVDALTPRAKDNVSLIAIWIFQWPIVILCTLFEDFLVKLAKNAARLLDAMFSYVSRKLVANATKGL